MWKGNLGDMHEFIPFANQTGKCERPYYPSDPNHVFASMNSLCYPSMRRCAISDRMNHCEPVEPKGILEGIVHQKKSIYFHPRLIQNP